MSVPSMCRAGSSWLRLSLTYWRRQQALVVMHFWVVNMILHLHAEAHAYAHVVSGTFDIENDSNMLTYEDMMKQKLVTQAHNRD